MRAQSRSTLALVLAPLVLVWCAWLFLDPRHSPNFYDYSVYARAGNQAVAHETVYQVLDPHFQFKYAPSVALIFGATISRLPNDVGPWVFSAFNAVLWILLFSLISGRAWERLVKRQPSPASMALLPLIAAFFYAMPLRDELKLGQTNAIPFLALYFVFDLERRGARSAWLRGLCFSIAVQFKLYTLLAAPTLILRRQWQVLAWALGWTLAINGLGLAAYHGGEFALSENLAWIRSLFASSSDLVTMIFNISLLGTMSREFGVVAGWTALIAALGGFLWAQYRVRREDPFFQFALVTAAVPVLNPIAWPYWMLLSFPAFTIVLVRILDRGIEKDRLISVGLAVALPGALLQNTPYGLEGFCLLGNAAMCLTLFAAWPHSKTYA